jgi:hypothetical protein
MLRFFSILWHKILFHAAGAWTSVLQHRVDSENYLSGTDAGTYNTAVKITEAVTGYTPGTPATVMPGITGIVVANLQSYFFQVDQGTAAYPLVLTLTSNTGKTTSINLTAGNANYWDVSMAYTPGSHVAAALYGIFSVDNNAGTATAFGTSIASATLNIPAGLAYTGTVNLTGRISTS